MSAVLASLCRFIVSNRHWGSRSISCVRYLSARGRIDLTAPTEELRPGPSYFPSFFPSFFPNLSFFPSYFPFLLSSLRTFLSFFFFFLSLSCQGSIKRHFSHCQTTLWLHPCLQICSLFVKRMCDITSLLIGWAQWNWAFCHWPDSPVIVKHKVSVNSQKKLFSH